MPDDYARIPALAVPTELHDLLRLYAYQNRCSLSEAVRRLLVSSPDLIRLAKESGVSPEKLNLNGWGGARGKK